MNIGVAYENGRIAGNLGDCRTFLIVSAEDGNPTGKRLAAVEGGNTTDLIKMVSMEKVDVLICGALGLALRNALEMIGVLLVPGCEGAAEEAVAKFLVGEKQGDPTRWRACTTVRSARAAARSRSSARYPRRKRGNKA